MTGIVRGLLARIGYVPVAVVDEAWHEGRDRGEQDVREIYYQRARSLKAQYQCIERHRDALIEHISKQADLQMPRTIIIKEPNHG